MSNHYENIHVDRLYSRIWGEGIHFGLYETGQESPEDASRATRRHMARFARAQQPALTLEVASGHGLTARELTTVVKGRIVATNHAENHHRIAAERTAEAGLTDRISHGLADFHNLPFFDNLFDLYWCQEAFVHASDKQRLFAEAARVLAPGGCLVFSDQTTDKPACTASEREKIAARHGSPDLCSAADFSELAAATGLRIESVTDWSSHMTRHFEKLVEKIEVEWDILAGEIDGGVLKSNDETWRLGAKLAREGKIGWHLFIARKPEAATVL